MGTWNINGDKNPALEDQYPAILDAWILDGPENISAKHRKENAIPTIGKRRLETAQRMIAFQVLSVTTTSNPCQISSPLDSKRSAISPRPTWSGKGQSECHQGGEMTRFSVQFRQCHSLGGQRSSALQESLSE